MVCNVLHGALLLLFIATLTPVRGLPVEDKPSCSPHLMAPNGAEMEMDIYTYYKSDYPGCLGLFLSNIFNSKRGEQVLNELVLKKEDGALICNGFVRLLSLIDAYGLTPKMCDGKALPNEEREFCTKTYPLKRAQISELASRLDKIGDSGLRDMARVLLSLEDHCEDVCDGIFDSALCGGFVDAGLFFMANYNTAVKNKDGIPSGAESELGKQHGTGTEQHGTETEQSSLKSGKEENVTTLPDSQSTVRTQPAQQPTDSSPTLRAIMKYFEKHPDALQKFLENQKSSSSPLGRKDQQEGSVTQPTQDVPSTQPPQQDPQQSSQAPQKPQLSRDDLAKFKAPLKTYDVRNPSNEKVPGQSRYEQNVLPQDGGQEVAGGEKLLAGSEQQLPLDQEDSEQQLTPQGNVSELSKDDQSQQHEPLVTSSETPAVTSSETPTVASAETPPAEGAETPAVTSSETPTVASAEPPPAEGAETPAAAGAETPLNEGDKPPTDASDETPLDEGDKGDETPPDVSDETPPDEGAETGGPLYNDDEESNTEYEEAVYDDSLDDNETEEALEKEMEEFLKDYEEEYEEENANNVPVERPPNEEYYKEQYANMDSTPPDIYMDLSVMPKVAFEGGAVESRKNARDDVLLLFAAGLIVIAIGIGIYQYSEEKWYQAERKLLKEVKLHVHEPTILIAHDVPEKTHITGLKR